MPTHRPAPLSVALLALAACGAPAERLGAPDEPRADQPAAPGEPAPAAGEARAAWMAVVSRQLRDGARAFVADRDGWRASISERGITGRFGADGVDLGVAEDTLTVRTLAVGRGAAPDPWAPAAPALGACDGDRVDPTGRCVRRLEYAGEVATEWWAGTPEGFEQGWTLDVAPAGEGPLAIVLGVEDADVVVDDGEVWLEGHGGGLLAVGGFAAWDADGAALDIRVTRAPEGFRVEVDDAGARYPVEIDPVYTSTAWAVDGTAGYARFGYAVAGVGDVDGDGYDDVAVGSSGTSDVGAVYVYPGSASGLSSDASVLLNGQTSGDEFGGALDGAGDVNGDGYDDVVVGAQSYSSDKGRVYVYLGSAAGLSSTAAVTLDGEVTSDNFGCAVAGAGDVDADGYADVIVGAEDYGSYGKAYVYRGSASGLSTTATTTMTSASSYFTGSHFGGAVDGAGDINGDGYDDVIVGEYGYDTHATGDQAGRVHLYLGSAAGSSASAATTRTGTTDSQFGYSVAGVGDVDGDGYDDIVVGANEYASYTGRAYLYHGSSAGLATSAATTFTAEAASDRFAYDVAGAGDINGDGYDDVVIGAYYASSQYGRAYVYAGSVAGVSATATTTLTGESASWFGWSVAGAGDVDGDGDDELLVGAYAYGGADPGRAYLFEGDSAGLSTTPSTYLDSHYEDGLGEAVDGAGDVNGDGYDDVIVGAPGYIGDVGAVFVYTGSASGLSTTAATTIEGGDPGDVFGRSVSGAGDVNGDGYDDVIVGADGYSSSTGRAYVFHGSAAGLSSTATTTITGGGTSYYLGYSVSDAGDVNADGYADVVVGAYGYSSSRGRAYVFLGSASGVSTSANLALTGSSASDGLGTAVAGAGDVNGDGYDDVAIAAPGYSSSTGAVYVHHGSATGAGSSVARTLTGYSASNQFGCAISAAGDVNADGYGDLIVGAYAYTSYTGRAYVYHGSSAGIPASPASALTGAAASDYLGYRVGGAGDVNADGYDDVIVGAFGYSSMRGRAYVYEGSASGVSSGTSTSLTGSVAAGRFGAAVAGAGDVDGDGYADVIVGSSAGSGAAAVYRGYADADGDGVGTDDDCDDTDPAITTPYAAYADADGDGYGDPAVTTTACAAVPGYVADATDCDDTTAAVSPGVAEVCDAADVDEDCDGLADDADAGATGKTTSYVDADGDGYGSAPADWCDAPAGHVADGTDCDDAAAGTNPGAVELCDAADTDEDCDGFADDADGSATGQSTWHADADGDGFGGATTMLACDQPTAFVADATDCDDGAAGTNPGAAEVCDAADVDEDCDGLADDADGSATGQSTWHADADADGFGGATTTLACDQPPAFVADATDCDDGAAGTNPAAAEVCDATNVDEDCDGAADDADASATGASTWYVDADGDGFGGAGTTDACDLPAGHAATAGDCDDTSAAVSPLGGETVGDGVDGDCDGGETCYADADGDGYRDAATLTSADADCADAGEAPAAAAPDCDDADAGVGPGADEVIGDGVDQDCDGAEICYADADADGYRDDAGTVLDSADLDCAGPGEASEALPTGDCDDADPAFHPGADEGNCADPADYNCDGSAGYADADGDGFAACEDCDDARTSTNPDADERCNGRDDDCDGAVDDNAVDSERWYADADGDGYTDPDASVLACDPPAGYAAATEEDCDDDDAGAHPEADDLPGDGIDQDCDGADAVDTGEADDTGPADSGGDTGGGPKDEGCGCAGTPGPVGWAPVLALLAFARRRRA